MSRRTLRDIVVPRGKVGTARRVETYDINSFEDFSLYPFTKSFLISRCRVVSARALCVSRGLTHAQPEALLALQ